MYTELLPEVYDIMVRDDSDARHRAFLVNADEPTLVDTGLPDTTDALFKGLGRIGLEPERTPVV